MSVANEALLNRSMDNIFTGDGGPIQLLIVTSQAAMKSTAIEISVDGQVLTKNFQKLFCLAQIGRVEPL